MSGTAARWLFVVAGGLLVVGIIVGFSPVKSNGYDCGSFFVESDDLLADEFRDTMTGGDGMSGCDDARASRAPVVWSAFGLAAFLGVVAMVGYASQEKLTGPPPSGA